MNATAKKLRAYAKAVAEIGEDRCEVVIAGVRLVVKAKPHTTPMSATALRRALLGKNKPTIHFKSLHAQAAKN